MFRLARSLLLADAVTPDALAEALLLSATRGTSLVRALLATDAIDAPQLELHLERGNAPYMRHVAAVPPLLQGLPPGLCERLLALPVRRDPRTGTVDVAVVDPSDPHPAEEIGHWLKVPVRVVRTSLASLDAALRRTSEVPDEGLRSLAPPIWVPPYAETPRPVANTPAHGSPALGASANTTADGSPSPMGAPNPAVDPNIPFALTRKGVAPSDSLGTAADRKEETPDPVLDLRRPKTSRPAAAEAPEQPVTVRGPFGLGAESGQPTARPSAEFAAILGEIREAHDRDAILELVLAGACTIARRAAVLAFKRGALIGWTCSSELADRAALRTVHLIAAGTALAPALDHGGARLVRIPLDATHAPLLWVMNTPPAKEVALVAMRVEGKPVAVVFADGLNEPLQAVLRLEEIAQVAEVAIAAVLRQRRK
jgi:type II secretion system (T2SS) protein E